LASNLLLANDRPKSKIKEGNLKRRKTEEEKKYKFN